jgi:predicted glycosyltransferase
MGPRFFLYSHDSYGLGHLRRSIAVARGLVAAHPRAQVLIATGSPKAGSFDLPPRTRCVRLPGVTKDAAGRYVPRDLPCSLQEVLDLRTGVIQRAVDGFAPDLILVDHTPTGLGGELLPVLRRSRWKTPDRAIVLGLRDITDDPARVRAAWRSLGIDASIEELYDRVLVYGQRSVSDPIAEYGLSSAVARKTTFTGYVDAREPANPGRVRRALRLSPAERLVLVTVGGGGDGADLVRAYMDGLAARGGRTGWRSLVITGPLMNAADREAAQEAAAELPGVDVISFTPRLVDCVAAADAVVSMGGYNTTVETLARGKRMICVPRVFPRREQLVRARRLGGLGLLRWIHPRRLAPATLIETVGVALGDQAPRVAGRFDLGGVQGAARALTELLEGRAVGSPRLAGVAKLVA